MAHRSGNATWQDTPSTATLVTAARLEALEGAVDLSLGVASAVSVSGTPTSGQTIVATSGTAASWQTPSSGGPPPFLPLAVYSGKYTASGDGTVSTQAVDVSQYTLYVPYTAATSTALTAIAAEVTTASASSTIGIGVFGHDSTTGWPTTRLVDLGTIDSSTTGVKEATGAVTQVAGTVYWVGFWFSAAAATLRGNNLAGAARVPAATSTRFTGSVQQVATSASLPTTPASLSAKDRSIWFCLKG